MGLMVAPCVGLIITGTRTVSFGALNMDYGSWERGRHELIKIKCIVLHEKFTFPCETLDYFIF